MSEPDYLIEVYKGRKQGRQVWRWRAINEGNHTKMATGGEAYVNKDDAIHAAESLFSPANTVHLIETDSGSQMVLRDGLPAVNCQHCGHSVVLHMTDAGCQNCECNQWWAIQT